MNVSAIKVTSNAYNGSNTYNALWDSSTGVSVGTHTLKAVARDLSGLETTNSATTIQVAGYSGNYSLFNNNPPESDFSYSPSELGVRFSVNANGNVLKMRFYKSVNNTVPTGGTRVGKIWVSGSSTPMATVDFTGETASGWQEATFAIPVAIEAGTEYVASYNCPLGSYTFDQHRFDNAITNGPLTAPAGGNGVYSDTEGTITNNSYNNTNYGVDVVFTTD